MPHWPLTFTSSSLIHPFSLCVLRWWSKHLQPLVSCWQKEKENVSNSLKSVENLSRCFTSLCLWGSLWVWVGSVTFSSLLGPSQSVLVFKLHWGGTSQLWLPSPPRQTWINTLSVSRHDAVLHRDKEVWLLSPPTAAKIIHTHTVLSQWH